MLDEWYKMLFTFCAFVAPIIFFKGKNSCTMKIKFLLETVNTILVQLIKVWQEENILVIAYSITVDI